MSQNPSASRYDKALSDEGECRTNLYNAGLKEPSAYIAYRAALAVGANGYEAWEAAREYCRTETYRRLVAAEVCAANLTAADRASGRQPSFAAAVSSARETFDTYAALPNPFALQVAA